MNLKSKRFAAHFINCYDNKSIVTKNFTGLQSKILLKLKHKVFVWYKSLSFYELFKEVCTTFVSIIVKQSTNEDSNRIFVLHNSFNFTKNQVYKSYQKL